MILRLLNDISGRPDTKLISINFYEWLFVRQCANAWTVAAGSVDSITKSELFDIAMKVMPHNSGYEGQIKNSLFQAIDYKGFQSTFTFLDMSNLFHKFVIFSEMQKHNSVDGVLSIE